jgi:hypothetical protein
MTERHLEVVVKRNPARDHDVYVGYDFYWTDGSPAGVSFDCLCKLGQRAFFGKMPPPLEAQVELHYLPTWEKPEGYKGWRLTHKIDEQGVGKFLLQDGTETVFLFKPSDDPRVRDWAGLSAGAGDHPFTFRADLKGFTPCSTEQPPSP